jgi:hypothetical protein
LHDIKKEAHERSYQQPNKPAHCLDQSVNLLAKMKDGSFCFRFVLFQLVNAFPVIIQSSFVGCELLICAFMFFGTQLGVISSQFDRRLSCNKNGFAPPYYDII